MALMALYYGGLTGQKRLALGIKFKTAVRMSILRVSLMAMLVTVLMFSLPAYLKMQTPGESISVSSMYTDIGLLIQDTALNFFFIYLLLILPIVLGIWNQYKKQDKDATEQKDDS